MLKDGRTHPLDRPVARVAAAAVALAACGVLVLIHREELAVALAGPTAAPEDPTARCIAEHHATIDKGVDEGVFTAEQAALFKRRAEGLCRATVAR